METRHYGRSPRLSQAPHKAATKRSASKPAQQPGRSQTTTTATTLSAGRVGGSRGNVLDAADLHAGTGKSTESRLGTGTGGLGTVT